MKYNVKQHSCEFVVLVFCLAADKEAISSTISLPDGLHKVVQTDALLPAPKLGVKKLSFRRKQTKDENGD